MSEIVVADLVPLAERGIFLGLLGLVWAISSAIGPVMGGALATNWRWLFYLNRKPALQSNQTITEN
jgi:MFS family permease